MLTLIMLISERVMFWLVFFNQINKVLFLKCLFVQTMYRDDVTEIK